LPQRGGSPREGAATQLARRAGAARAGCAPAADQPPRLNARIASWKFEYEAAMQNQAEIRDDCRTRSGHMRRGGRTRPNARDMVFFRGTRAHRAKARRRRHRLTPSGRRFFVTCYAAFTASGACAGVRISDREVARRSNGGKKGSRLGNTTIEELLAPSGGGGGIP